MTAEQIHAAIKAHYLSQGRSEKQWQEVAANPEKFNYVWRHMLKLPADTKPPPAAYRSSQPNHSKPYEHFQHGI